MGDGDFSEFVRLLVEKAEFDKPINKPKVSDEALVKEIRMRMANQAPPSWRLWESGLII